jgi:hypothetical protein
MTEQHRADAATAAAIEANSAGRWGVWRSDTGWWWATRTRALGACDLAAGAVPFLHADSPSELTECIRQQDLLTPTHRQESPVPPGQAPSQQSARP